MITMKTYPVINKLYPTIEEFECPNYKCKNCKHFKFVMPNTSPSGCNHRFDHNLMEYARPWFDHVPEESGFPCADFEPDGLYKAAVPYWHGYAHWREWMRRQDEEDGIKPTERSNLIGFRLKQAPHEFYYVRLEDYVNGTMWDGNKLKAVGHSYYTNSRKDNRIATEEIDGVIVEGGK